MLKDFKKAKMLQLDKRAITDNRIKGHLNRLCIILILIKLLFLENKIKKIKNLNKNSAINV